MTFGERLKMFCETRGLTQTQLAELVGVAKTTITGYEKGNREPDVAKIKKLAVSLGVTGDDLLGTEFLQKEKPTVKNDEELSDMEQIFISPPPALRQEALRYVEYLVEREGKQG